MATPAFSVSITLGVSASSAAGHLRRNAAADPTAGGDGTIAQAPTYQVQITDDTGRVVAVQKFDSLEQAREFTDDLTKWQLRQQQLQQGQVVLVGDTF